MLQEEFLPELQGKAMQEFVEILDDMLTELGQIDGGMGLISELTLHIRVKPDFTSAEPHLQTAVRLLSEKPSDVGNKLLRKIAGITLAIQKGLHEEAVRNEFKPIRKEDEVEPMSKAQKQDLQDYLRTKYIEETRLEIGNINMIFGGGSKQTLILDLLYTSELPEKIVVRIDRLDSVTGSTVADEYNYVETMYKAGMPVPQPFLLEIDTSFLGGAFIIVSHIEGHNIGDWISVTEPSREFAVDLARALAIMHQVPVASIGHQQLNANISSSEQVLNDICTSEKLWRGIGTPSIVHEQAYAWLKDHIELANGIFGVVHGDVGCHNMLCKDGRLTALLDWETAFIGNPTLDIAYVHYAIIEMMPWEEFLAEYEKAGGTLPSQAEMDFYMLWTKIYRLQFIVVARSYVASGISSAIIHAYGAQMLYQRCEYDLHEKMNDIYERY